MFGLRNLFNRSKNNDASSNTQWLSNSRMPSGPRDEIYLKPDNIVRYDLMSNAHKMLDTLCIRLKGFTFKDQVHTDPLSPEKTTEVERSCFRQLNVNGERFFMLSLNEGAEMYKIDVVKGFLGLGSKIVVTPRRMGSDTSLPMEFGKNQWANLAEALEDAAKGRAGDFRGLMTPHQRVATSRNAAQTLQTA